MGDVLVPVILFPGDDVAGCAGNSVAPDVCAPAGPVLGIVHGAVLHAADGVFLAARDGADEDGLRGADRRPAAPHERVAVAAGPGALLAGAQRLLFQLPEGRQRRPVHDDPPRLHPRRHAPLQDIVRLLPPDPGGVPRHLAQLRLVRIRPPPPAAVRRKTLRALPH